MLRRRLCVVMLRSCKSERAAWQETGSLRLLPLEEESEEGEGVCSLECIQLVLPATVQLEPHLHAPEDHLLAALEVDAELNDIAIVDGERPRFRPRRAEPNVVEEGAGAALHVLDIPFPPSYQNSQCRRLTTLLLKPTGAAEGTFTGMFAALSSPSSDRPG